MLDDSTDETVQVARACVERYRALGLPIHYLHRNDRSGFKAGEALEAGPRIGDRRVYWLSLTPISLPYRRISLRRTLPYLTRDPKIAMVQTRWTYLNSHYSALTEVETILLDGHFVMEHGARSRSGDFFNFNGTAGVWRRHAPLTKRVAGSTTRSLRIRISPTARSFSAGEFLYLPDIECAFRIARRDERLQGPASTLG